MRLHGVDRKQSGHAYQESAHAVECKCRVRDVATRVTIYLVVAFGLRRVRDLSKRSSRCPTLHFERPHLGGDSPITRPISGAGGHNTLLRNSNRCF